MEQHPEVQAAHSRYLGQVEQIRADKNLSPAGKQRRLAQVWTAASDAVADVSRAVENTKTLRRRELEQQLLGPGAPPLGATTSDRIARDSSFRDAVARCAQTASDKPHELQELLGRAIVTGDSLMERAAAVVACERRDIETMNRFLEVHPELDGGWNELWAGGGVKQDLAAAVALAAPPAPDELAGMGQTAIRALAEAPPPPPAPSPFDASLAGM